MNQSETGVDSVPSGTIWIGHRQRSGAYNRTGGQDLHCKTTTCTRLTLGYVITSDVTRLIWQKGLDPTLPKAHFWTSNINRLGVTWNCETVGVWRFQGNTFIRSGAGCNILELSRFSLRKGGKKKKKKKTKKLKEHQ